MTAKACAPKLALYGYLVGVDDSKLWDLLAACIECAETLSMANESCF